MACITTAEGRRDTLQVVWIEKVASTGVRKDIRARLATIQRENGTWRGDHCITSTDVLHGGVADHAGNRAARQRPRVVMRAQRPRALWELEAGPTKVERCLRVAS